jgi:hypothetical protein
MTFGNPAGGGGSKFDVAPQPDLAMQPVVHPDFQRPKLLPEYAIAPQPTWFVSIITLVAGAVLGVGLSGAVTSAGVNPRSVHYVAEACVKNGADCDLLDFRAARVMWTWLVLGVLLVGVIAALLICSERRRKRG